MAWSTPSLVRTYLTLPFQQDSENNTILILLADTNSSLNTQYSPSDPELMGSALRMARLYYDRYPFTLDWVDSSGKTALHVAALKGNEELARVCFPVVPVLFVLRYPVPRCCAT